MTESRETGDRQNLSPGEQDPDPTGQIEPPNPLALPTLRLRVGHLLEEFLAEPNGPARQILELSTLSYWVSVEDRSEERALREAAESQSKAEAVRVEAEALRHERTSLAQQNRSLAAEFTRARRALDHELRIIEHASKKREITQAEIVKRISNAFGLGGEPEPRIETPP